VYDRPVNRLKAMALESDMHGFHASSTECEYGLAIHLVSIALTAIGVVILLIA
jgi:hypothetical protein